MLAVLLVLEEHPPEGWRAALTLFGTSLAIALAETYSEFVAEMIGQRRGLGHHEFLEIWHHARPILLAANVPTAFALAAGAGLLEVEDALNYGIYAMHIALFVWGIRVGQLIHSSLPRIILSGFITLGIGLSIGLLKVAFH